MKKITLENRNENTTHEFDVVNPDRLTRLEIDIICEAMNVKSIFVNGKIYNY